MVFLLVLGFPRKSVWFFVYTFNVVLKQDIEHTLETLEDNMWWKSNRRDNRQFKYRRRQIGAAMDEWFHCL